MNKVNGKKASFAPVREDGSRITICYGLKKLNEDLYEWYEVYLPKTQTPALSLQVVKDAIIGDINARTDEKIVSGFVWNPAAGGDPIPVWLSTENQFNFKSAYDLAIQKNGATLPVTFKMGEHEDGTPVYHTFKTMEDADDFYVKAVAYINLCLAQGWEEKDGIDWTPYEALFPQSEQASNTEQ
jgi:hypothetical protein